MALEMIALLQFQFDPAATNRYALGPYFNCASHSISQTGQVFRGSVDELLCGLRSTASAK